VVSADEAGDPLEAEALGWAGRIRVPFPLESQVEQVETPTHFRPSLSRSRGR
jgi:hypothetical protein